MPPPPRILAIETSGRHGSVAIALGPTLLAARDLPATSRHAIELMPAIADLTSAQGWKPHDLDHLYLSLGPGSFTGLRIAVAIARAMHQASPPHHKLHLVGVPSLDVIAHNAPPHAAIVLPILDAKRGQVFSARYQRLPGNPQSLTQTAPPALVDPAAFLQAAIAIAERLPPSTQSKTQIALLGEGIDFHRLALTPPPSLPQAVEIIELPKSLWHGNAATVHRLGLARAARREFSDPATLLPLYIRLPEAEEVYRKKHGLPVP